MITTDLHNHTHHSHARDSVQSMFEAAVARGLTIYGFSEHSARPLGYDVPNEYREHLAAGFPTYLEEVRALQQRTAAPRVLLGLELDWLPDEIPFLTRAVRAEPFDYVLGGIHYLKTWSFDNHAQEWEALPDEACFAHYVAYFETFTKLAHSGLVHIIAHPDIIKIYSNDRFQRWLCGDNLDLVRDALVALRDNGLLMEISSAGLRKACHEIYPGPKIMALAADLGVRVAFSSDAHSTEQVAFAFDELARYAHSFGYTHSHVYIDGDLRSFVF